MKTIREKFLTEEKKVVVYVGNYFGIFNIEEFASLLNRGATPRGSPSSV